VADPGEGVAADGTIRTGADLSKVPSAFEPVLADAAAMADDRGASLYVYGSVANGTVRPGSSDVRVARKTLLAVAGLVSVRDRTWTTDRARATRRWGEIEPGLAVPLRTLRSWATAERRPAREEVPPTLAGDGIVATVVERFADLIGLWPDDH
jgi:hypothetical protein